MEVIKNIAAVIGVLLSAATLLAFVSDKARNIAAKFFGHIFKKYGNKETLDSEIADIKKLLERHIEEEQAFKDGVMRMNEINIEFTKTQCRNIIKNTFYKYNDSKVLPLYEKKTLMYVDDLYTKQLEGNSFASLLLSEMSEWDIDYGNSYQGEPDKE